MSTVDALLIALIVSKVLLITVIFFFWRSNGRLKEANHIIFLMRRRGIINEKDLEELRKKPLVNLTITNKLNNTGTTVQRICNTLEK